MAAMSLAVMTDHLLPEGRLESGRKQPADPGMPRQTISSEARQTCRRLLLGDKLIQKGQQFLIVLCNGPGREGSSPRPP